MIWPCSRIGGSDQAGTMAMGEEPMARKNTDHLNQKDRYSRRGM